jgi:single-stranded-DNA-specific exonuclease
VRSRVEKKVVDENERGTFTRQSRVEENLVGAKPCRSSTPQRRWILSPPEELNGGAISWKEICDSECIARLLLRKGFASAGEVDAFLRPKLSSLGDPFLLPQMEKAVARILAALDRHERIVLFGDYDVDGVTSLALLSEMLRAYSGAPELFLPLRMEEGYGLSRESVERCVDQHHPQLLIAVDCGTSSCDEIVDLKKRGVDVIVLDHHEPKSALPDCVAIVNPKIEKTGYEYLCSVGIVFKLCHALLKTRELPDFDLKSQLDLVALGTVADIVPLRGENRILVHRGATQIANSSRPGLKKLIEVSGVRAPILTEDIGFKLGPRLNAAGRLTTAEKSLRVLLTRDETEATELAQFLDQQNRDRQQVEKEIMAAAEEKIESEPDRRLTNIDAAIVLAERGWHPGVLGIVASRIARKYHRPTIVIGIDADGVGKGSGRSIEGLNLVEALKRCSQRLQKFGGHEMAAGLTIREQDVDLFAKEFAAAARELLSADDLQPRLRLDHELVLDQIDIGFLRWHEMLQPFGNENPQPLFIARQVRPVAPPVVLNNKHLRLRIGQGGSRHRAIFFNGATARLPEPPWDIAFRIRADNFGGGETLVEMRIEALREAGPLE